MLRLVPRTEPITQKLVHRSFNLTSRLQINSFFLNRFSFNDEGSNRNGELKDVNNKIKRITTGLKNISSSTSINKSHELENEECDKHSRNLNNSSSRFSLQQYSEFGKKHDNKKTNSRYDSSFAASEKGEYEKSNSDPSKYVFTEKNGNRSCGNTPPLNDREDKKSNSKNNWRGGASNNSNVNEDTKELSLFLRSMVSLKKFLFKCLETIGITFSSVAILGIAGLLYHRWYNNNALNKIDLAFENGDPAFQLQMHERTSRHVEDECDGSDISQWWVERPQQKIVDDIVSGQIIGRYFLVIGEKGTGKTSLLLEAMKKIDGYNVAIFDAHADTEIFRIRLGKALNYNYSEDYIGSLFSIRGPRDTTALLDIERAFGKLEELAIRRVSRSGRPLVLIINNAHLIKENEDGEKLIELLQQKAESLSGSGLVSMIFNSDDYWVYEKLKKLGTKLELINVRDFDRAETVKAVRFIREKHFPGYRRPDFILDDKTCHNIYDLIGGRPQHISQVARHKDIIKACHEIIDREKTWFLNQCGLLGPEMDDDVMESAKFSVSAMLLMRKFVEMDRQRLNSILLNSNPCDGDRAVDHELPELPLWRSRQIMTRADYIQRYDDLNIFTIDSDSRVRADSVPMMRAFHEIASQPFFDQLLKDTMIRVADIESLGRTRELVAKDLLLGYKYVTSSKEQGRYQINMESLEEKVDEEQDDEDLHKMDGISLVDAKSWWKRRTQHFNQKYLPPSSNERKDSDMDVSLTS